MDCWTMYISDPEIALDFDGVLGDTIKSWVNIYNEIFQENRAYEEIDTWHFHEKFGMNVEQSMRIFSICWKDPIKHIYITEADLGYKIRELYKMSYKLDIVTAIPKEYHSDIEKWLNFYCIPHDGIVYSVYKEQTDYDIFIDDKPALLHRAKPRPVIMKKQRWNKLEDPEYSFDSFDEVPKMIEDILKYKDILT